MNIKSNWLNLLAACLLLGVSTGSAAAYDYPFSAYVATIVGTPPEFAEKLPNDVPVKVDKRHRQSFRY
jgi:hypothetical protein